MSCFQLLPEKVRQMLVTEKVRGAVQYTLTPVLAAITEQQQD